VFDGSQTILVIFMLSKFYLTDYEVAVEAGVTNKIATIQH